MIEALIFDFDGVIIDTETPDFETWQEVFGSFGVELDHSYWSQFIGGGESMDIFGRLETLAGVQVDREAIRVPRRRRYLELIDSNPVLEGVQKYIAEGRELGLRLGVASSSGREWVEGHLTKRGLLGYFDSVKSASDVSRVKPDPELYLAAVTDLGADPGRAIAIEDSANGVTAAKEAGLFCVAVPNPMTRGMALDRADLLVSSLSELPLAELLDRAGRARS